MVELDGGQHADEAQTAHDRRRTVYLTSQGFKVIRFWNEEIFKEPERVMEQIYQALAEQGSREPSP